MKEVSQTITKEAFFDNFTTKNIMDGLSPFRKKWSIIVLMEFKDDKIVTFQNLQLKFSMSPSVLSSTLRELTFEKLISRKVYGQIPPLKVEYSITPHGGKMTDALCNLIELVYENKKID